MTCASLVPHWSTHERDGESHTLSHPQSLHQQRRGNDCYVLVLWPVSPHTSPKECYFSGPVTWPNKLITYMYMYLIWALHLMVLFEFVFFQKIFTVPIFLSLSVVMELCTVPSEGRYMVHAYCYVLLWGLLNVWFPSDVMLIPQIRNIQFPLWWIFLKVLLHVCH